MRLWPLGFGLAALSVGLWPMEPQGEPWSIVISGDTLGYLSPCGCTYPMMGGIKRRATAVRHAGEHVLFLDTGSLTKETGKQSEMKAQAMAEALAASHVDAINLTSYDASLGKGSVLAVARLSKEKLIATQWPENTGIDLPRWRSEGPFLIGGATTKPQAIQQSLGVQPRSLRDAVEALTNEAMANGKQPVLMLEGSLDEARRVAGDFPALALVIYRSVGEPPASPEREGATLLVTPGDRGRTILRLSFDGSSIGGYVPEKLGPEVADDKDVSRIYAMYLKRVDSSDLLEKLPRTKGKAFAGTKKCASCHGAADKVWKKSAHSHALLTLEKDGHARDPDCVSCHVVGLSFDTGFKSRVKTPWLTDVGCESCHGAGMAHSLKPKLVKMGKVGAASCAPCHTVENSPRFDFKSYWQKIRH